MSHTGYIVYRIKSRLRGLPREAGWRLGLNHSFARNARGGRILVYHGVCLSDPLRFNTLFVTLKNFEAHLRFYKKHFNIVSLDDFYERRFSQDKFNICITFDDGFANNHKYVLPLLEKYQVPATFFMTGIREAGYDILWNDVLSIACKYGPARFMFRDEEFIKGDDRKYKSASTGEPLTDLLRSSGFDAKEEVIGLLDNWKNRADPDYWLQMDTEQIRTLSASRWVTIGSHGYHHDDLAKIPAWAAKDDIDLSKTFLEKITGREIHALAFPYGSYTREVVQQAKDGGFSQLLATGFIYPEDRDDPAMRERLTINPFISNINQMHANITGNY